MAPAVKVWSERNDPFATGWKDCTYSAGLMALIWGGWFRFPLGVYTVGEREALERSDNRPDETGATLDDLRAAVARRYKLTLPKPKHIDALASQLDTPGLAIIVQGSNGNLPPKHPLRRWDPSSTVCHAVTVLTTTAGLRWLDPESPMGRRAAVVSRATVLKWATGYGDSIIVRRLQYA